MQVGLQMPAHDVPDPRSFYRELAQTAAAAGFSSLWVGDHLLWRRPRLEATAVLALVAGQTDLSIGTAILLAPLRSALWTAKTALTLDQLTGGRFVLGLGSGGEYSREFDALGVDRRERGAHLDETLEVCRSAWHGDPAGLAPHPTNGTIPIWLAARQERALRRAAEVADGWLGVFLQPHQFAERLAQARDYRRSAGIDRPLHAAMVVWTVSGDEDAKARAERDRFLQADYGSAAERVRPYVPAGRPTDIAELLIQYGRSGVDTLVLHMASDDPIGQVRVFGDFILPAVRTRLGDQHVHG